MAMENKRIIQLNTERTTPTSGDYVMVDSATDGTAKYQLSKITDAIDQEISDRTSADTALQTAITNEATARTNADTALQENITAEATARTAADSQLREDLNYNFDILVNPNDNMVYWDTDRHVEHVASTSTAFSRLVFSNIPVIAGRLFMDFAVSSTDNDKFTQIGVQVKQYNSSDENIQNNSYYTIPDYITINAYAAYINVALIATAVAGGAKGEDVILKRFALYRYNTSPLDVSNLVNVNGSRIENETVSIIKLASDVASITRNLFYAEFHQALYNGSGNYNPSESNSTAAIAPDDFVLVSPGTAYILSWGSLPQASIGGTTRVYINYFDTNKSRISFDNVVVTNATRSITFTTPAGCTYFGIQIYNSSCADWTLLIPEHLMLEEGNIKTDYVPHYIINNDLIDVSYIYSMLSDGIRKNAYDITPISTVKSIAHRGDFIYAPQCTAPAYIMAKNNGATIAENDLALSEDYEFVMWHDTSLYRLGNMVDINGYLMYTDGSEYYWVNPDTNTVYTYDGEQYVISQVALETLTRCNGTNYAVNSRDNPGKIGLNLATLKRIDFGTWKSKEFAGTQILTFAEWTLLCKKIGLKMYVDHKFTYTNELVQRAAQIVRNWGMGKYASWLGLSITQIPLIREIIPGARCGTLLHPTAENVVAYAPYNTGDGFFFNGDLATLTREVTLIGLQAGFDVESYYVNYGDAPVPTIFNNIRNAIDMGVTGLTLDHYTVTDAIQSMLG